MTDEDVAVIKRLASKRRDSTENETGVTVKDNVISYNHEDNAIGQMALMVDIGVTDFDFMAQFINQIVNVATKGQDLDEDNANFMLSVIKGIEPQDQIEAMLGAHMAAVHMATMTFTRRLNLAETIRQQDSAEKTLNKLMRTFTTQMAALKKYRTGGEQKVKVEHVHVYEGGQAVVGNITNTPQNRGANGKN